MNITWHSRKGHERIFNSDAVALAYSGSYLLVVIVDAAERYVNNRPLLGINHQGRRLAAYWSAHTLTNILKAGVEPKESTLVSLLREQQKGLRKHFLHDIASYGVAVLNTTSGNLNWWYTGDCRIGISDAHEQITWLNTPHRLEESRLLKAFEGGGAENIAQVDSKVLRHTLTQSLNARRFCVPARITTQVPVGDAANGSCIVTATDGCWCEHLRFGTPMGELADDASVLTVKPGKEKLKLHTDTPNLLITYNR